MLSKLFVSIIVDAGAMALGRVEICLATAFPDRPGLNSVYPVFD